MKIFCKIFKKHTINLKNFFYKTEKNKVSHSIISKRKEHETLLHTKKKSSYSMNILLLGKNKLFFNLLKNPEPFFDIF